MFENRINLVSLYSLLMLGISLFMLSLAGQFYLEWEQNRTYYEGENHYDRENFYATLGFGFFGLLWLVISIALILRKNWARITMQVILVLSMAIWTLFLLNLMKNAADAWLVFIGLASLGYSLALFGILFLSNRHFTEHFHHRYQSKVEKWDILDQ